MRFISSLRRAHVLTRHRALVYTAAPISILAMLVVCVICGVFLAVARTGYMQTIMPAFWSTPRFALVGAFAVIVVAMIPWVTLPLIWSGVAPKAGKYVFRRDVWLGRCGVLIVLTISGSAVVALAVPGIAMELSAAGFGQGIIWLVGGVPTGVGPLLHLARWGSGVLWQSEAERRLPTLVDFAVLRPLNTKVINLDVGALAPRLGCVDVAIRRWTRLAEEFAPTSNAIWSWASGSSSHKQLLRRARWTHAWRGAEALRCRVAELLNCAYGDIVFATSTTRALELALESIRPRVLISTDQEHPSEERLLRMVRSKYGCEVHRVPVPLDTDLDPEEWRKAMVEAVCERGMSESADCMLLSHVCYANGVVLPIPEIVRGLKERGCKAKVIVDGAHAVGQVPVDAGTLGADMYVFSGHKWLFGPPALGCLVLGKEVRLGTAVGDQLGVEAYEALALAERADAEGQGTATISLDPLVGLHAALLAMSEAGLREVWANISALRVRLERMVEASAILEVVDIGRGRVAPGIVNLQKRGQRLGIEALENLREELEAEFLVVVKVVSAPASIRVCLPFYLRTEELEHAVRSMEVVIGRARG